LIEQGGVVQDRHGHAVLFSEERTPLGHYLIVGHGSKGLELPDILSGSGEVILPVFSSEEAAKEFLALSSLGERWYVRGFSGGELVSVLFAFHAGMKGVLLDPHPGVLSGEVTVSLVRRDVYVTSLLDTGSYHLPSARLHSLRSELDTLSSDKA
jgi:hypothetical protein